MADIELKSVKLPNEETMGYRERAGDGPTLVLVHGNMNSSKHWDVLLESLDPLLHLIAVDLPGFGISTYYRPIGSLFDYSACLKLFIDELGLERFSLIGWSTGGGVVMKFAADYPQHVEKLIVLDSVSTRGYPFYADGPDGQPDPGVRLRTLEEIRALPRTQAISDAGSRRDKAFMRWLFDVAVYNINKPAEERYEAYLDDILTQVNLADIYHGLNTFNISKINNPAAEGSGDAERIEAPTLVIWGKQDLVIAESMTREIMEDLGPRAELVELKNSGHSPLIDALPELTREVERFVLGAASA